MHGIGKLVLSPSRRMTRAADFEQQRIENGSYCDLASCFGHNRKKLRCSVFDFLFFGLSLLYHLGRGVLSSHRQVHTSTFFEGLIMTRLIGPSGSICCSALIVRTPQPLASILMGGIVTFKLLEGIGFG